MMVFELFLKLRKNFLLFSLVLFFGFFHIQLVAANFVCGQVLDANDNMSSQWSLVRVYYDDNPSLETYCEVSPDQNKYCCDLEQIHARKWNIGDVIDAEVLDLRTGYFSDSVTLVKSGEGCDIFPQMQLKKAIRVFSPHTRLFVSDASDILLNARFEQPYTDIEIRNVVTNTSSTCSNCTSFNDTIHGSFGMNFFEIIAGFNGNVFMHPLSYAVIDSYAVDRFFTCDGCKNNGMRSSLLQGKNVTVFLSVNTSHSLQGLLLEEYVDRDFEIVDSGGGTVQGFSETHNVIVWNVSGKDITTHYVVRAPQTFLFPKRYHFRLELGGLMLQEEEALVRRFFSFFSFAQNYVSSLKKTVTVYRLSPQRPLVLRPKSGSVVRLAVFSNATIRDASFSLRQFEDSLGQDDVIDAYEFETNINNDHIEKIYIEFKVLRKEIVDKGYDTVALAQVNDFDSEDFSLVEVMNISSDTTYIYYSGVINASQGFMILGI